MCKEKLVLLVFFACSSQLAFAQAKGAPEKTRFQTILQAGLLNGSKSSSLALQAIGGFSVNRSFAGLGVGLDYYRFRSIPLFVDLRHEFGKGPRRFIMYGDLGYHFDWLTDRNKNEPWFSPMSDYQGSIYYDAGLGYQIAFEGRDALILSAGYSYKRIKNKIASASCPFATGCLEEKQTYSYSMPRLVIKAGWRF